MSAGWLCLTGRQKENREKLTEAIILLCILLTDRTHGEYAQVTNRRQIAPDLPIPVVLIYMSKTQARALPPSPSITYALEAIIWLVVVVNTWALVSSYLSRYLGEAWPQ